MNILQSQIKETKKRLQFKNSEIQRINYRYTKINANRMGYIPIRTLPKARLRNYCLISGSSRSVYSRSFRLSRHQVKNYFSYLKGLRISSW